MNSAQGRIVVGVDGSPSSRAALAWAVRQAGFTGASVEAIIAWQNPVTVAGVLLAPTGPLDNLDYGRWAASELNYAINQTVDPDGPVKVSATVQEGNPAEVLLDAAVGAELLVLGSRRHGGFREALLGSVGQSCAHHAQCPVVLVRGFEAG